MAETPITPLSYYGDSPPPRVMGSECEYNIDVSTLGVYSDGVIIYPAMSTFLQEQAITNAGFTSYQPSEWANFFLGNGARIYVDVGNIEYCSAEAAGPREATVADLAGRVVLDKITKASGADFDGVYRRAGYAPRPGERDTSGYHENFLIPVGLFSDPSNRRILRGYLATRMWAGGGIVTDSGYAWSQKAAGIGTEIGEYAIISDGNKPMYRVHNTHDDDWQRLEVRVADPLQSPLSRFISFGASSLVLRLIEHRAINAIDLSIFPADGVETLQTTMHDPTLRENYKTLGGGTYNGLALQRYLVHQANELSKKVKLPADEVLALRYWEETVSAFGKIQLDPANLKTAAKFSDAAAKRYALERQYGDDIANDNWRAVAKDMAWDRLNGQGAEFGFRVVETIPELRHGLGRAAVEQYVDDAPPDTAAAIRAAYLHDPSIELDGIGWHHIDFWTDSDDESQEVERITLPVTPLSRHN